MTSLGYALNLLYFGVSSFENWNFFYQFYL